MPPLWCRLDRLWFPHPGVLEGSITRQPFICPLDHVFEVDIHWDKFLLKQPLYLNSRISVTFSTSRQLTDKFMDFAFQRSSKWVRKISLRYIEHASLQFATPSLRLHLCDSTSPSFNIDSSSSNLDAAADNFYRPDLKKAALARVSVGHRSLKVSKSGVKKRNRQVVKTPDHRIVEKMWHL